MEVLSLCPFRAGALAWQSAPNAWSLTVVVKATFAIGAGGEATLAPVQAPVAAFAGDADAVEDLSPLKPRVDILVMRGRDEDAASVEVSSCVLPARGPIPPYAPMRRLLLREQALEWAAAVLRGEAATAGPAPEGFDFNFFHSAPRDQRVDLLRTGAPLVLNHILPNHARVETILPQRKPQAFRIHPKTGKASEIILRCDTLCIDASRGVFVLTFRGIADLDGASQSNVGTIVVAAHSAGKKIRGERIERFLRNGEPIEGESNDGRHPLEKRYDTVLAAPKGDTMALPEMDQAASGVWQAAPVTHGDSGIMRAPALPFQAASANAPPAPAPPALLSAPVGGRRKATLATPTDASRMPDMPFHGAPPPPIPDPHLPPPPPEGVFPPPPALLALAPPPELPPLIRPPPMLGKSFTQDEKTADLPPGHEESPEESTMELPPELAAATLRKDVPPAVVEAKRPAPPTPGLAGKPAPAAAKPPVAAPGAPKAMTTFGAGPAPKPPATVPAAHAVPKPAAAPAAPKPGAIAPKPVAPATVAPKPVAPAAVAPKAAAPKAPLKVPAPLGPKLKADAPAKPNAVVPAAVEKKPAPAAPAKPIPDKPIAPAADKPVAPAKPVAIRPMTATLPFPGMLKPDVTAAIAAAVAAAPPPAKAATPAEPEEPFHAADVLTLEQCAALEAELRHRSAARKTLLEKNQLSDEQWAAVQKHWSEAIARQTEVGERKLLLAYDAAYVAVQERLGVPVGIDTHAKLQVAAERGTSAGVLKELGLEPTDQMRLGRVWTQRLADEPARMRELAAAIEKARAG